MHTLQRNPHPPNHRSNHQTQSKHTMAHHPTTRRLPRSHHRTQTHTRCSTTPRQILGRAPRRPRKMERRRLPHDPQEERPRAPKPCRTQKSPLDCDKWRTRVNDQRHTTTGAQRRSPVMRAAGGPPSLSGSPVHATYAAGPTCQEGETGRVASNGHTPR